jgi:type VI secretion system protein ImpC
VVSTRTTHGSLRVRPPRVVLTYDVEIGGAVEARELPFVVGVLANFSGQPAEPLPRVRDRKFVTIDVDNFDAVLSAMKPRAQFSVQNTLTHDGSALNVELTFRSLEDFDPVMIARQVDPLRKLLDIRVGLADLQATVAANDRLEAMLAELLVDLDRLSALRKEFDRSPDAPPELLRRVITDAGLVDRSEGLAYMLNLVLRDYVSGGFDVQRDLRTTLAMRIAILDSILSEQLSAILRRPEVQGLEATWRGLAYLVRNSETSDKLKIKVLNVSKKEVLRELERAPEFDQSTLFKKVYDEEFGVFGGEPFSVLIGDFEIGRDPQDITLLDRMSNIAAVAHAPFIAAAAPELLNLTTFQELGLPRDLDKIFQMTEYARWRAFREREDAKYVALVLPRMLIRAPYGNNSSPISDFNFEEHVSGLDHSRYVWANSVYGLATRLTQAFATFGWTAAIRGVEGGGIVSALPVYAFKTDDGDTAAVCPTEVAITDRREKELSELGFIPLVHCKGTDFACFFSAQSCHKPGTYDQPAANSAARAAAQLPYVLALSRFVHYFKAMMRDKIGSFSSRAETEAYLNQWVVQYVNLDAHASTSTQARLPLRSARIEVTEVRGKQGAYRAVAFLLPNFQLEQVSVPLRVVMDLPRALY